MNTIKTIFKKELIDTIRDRRTLITMVVIPILLFPVLIGLVSRITVSQIQKAEEEVLNIGLITYGNAEDLRAILLERNDFHIIDGVNSDEVQKLIREDSLAGALVFDQNFDRQVADFYSGEVEVYYIAATEDQEIVYDRLIELVDEYEEHLLEARFETLNMDKTIIDTVQPRIINLATLEERIGQRIGGFLPYIFIIFCFIGSMYPAIDLGAGEKERGTLETLMASPASRLQIVTGKFGVVVMTGILSAVFAVIGLFVGLQSLQLELPPELRDALMGILQMKSILLILSLLLPLTVFFARMQLAISFYARSFKEAQSIITPLNIVVIIPLIIALLPGIELNSATALVPVMNVVLTTKAVISDTLTPFLMAEVYLSLFFLAGLSLFGCERWIRREETLFRSS